MEESAEYSAEYSAELNASIQLTESQPRSGADGEGCEQASAEWKEDLGGFHKCILVTVAEILQLRPGERLLDWGSGCGHKLTWANQLYGTHGLGIDLVASSVRWADCAQMSGGVCVCAKKPSILGLRPLKTKHFGASPSKTDAFGGFAHFTGRSPKMFGF